MSIFRHIPLFILKYIILNLYYILLVKYNIAVMLNKDYRN